MIDAFSQNFASWTLNPNPNPQISNAPFSKKIKLSGLQAGADKDGKGATTPLTLASDKGHRRASGVGCSIGSSFRFRV